MRKLNVIGMRYGRLTVVSEAPNRVSAGRPLRFVEVLCDCGTSKEVNLQTLQRGQTSSCGCYRQEATGDMARRHGESQTRLYRIWKGMHSRCYTPSASNFQYYGGRGIRVCAEWHTYEPFRDWALQNGYREDLTIDRRDNDGHYTPANCRWASHQEQCNNRSTRSK